MANIETYLQKILDAIYGEEVRGSIHDALEAMNTESSNAMSVASTAQDSAKASATQAQQSATKAQESADSAKNYSGKPPIIGSDGNWQTWDESSKAYQTTGKPSRGEQGVQGPKGDQGVSPTVQVSKVGKTTTITITDESGPHQFEIKDGNDGSGAGDMLASVYDTGSRSIDIFQYVDDLVGDIKTVLEEINGEASA